MTAVRCPADAWWRLGTCQALALSCIVSVSPVVGQAQTVRPTEEQDVAEAGRVLQPLGEDFTELDWRKEYRNIDRALFNVWRENGWNDEADLFARDLAREVSAIPPWRFTDRMTLVTERVTDRYRFTPEQRTRFQGILLREASAFLLHNAAQMLPCSQEAFRTRREGKPFTAEQVARWAKAGGPVMQDVRGRVERFVDELQPVLTPDQRRILQRDVSSYARRRDLLDKTLEQWAAGNWKPEDWGLQDDPIQTGTSKPSPEPVRPPAPQERADAAGSNARPPRGVLAMPKRWVDYDPSTWIAYVVEIEEKYKLDPGQVSTVESIHEELLERAEAYRASRRETLDAIPVAERSTHDGYAFVRETFAELRDRLSSIPTTAQRVAAESGPPHPTARPRDDP